MKSKYISTCTFVLVLAVMYAVSIGTAAAQSRGRLIVMRDPSLGRNLVVTLRIDGRTVANLMQGSRFDNSVWTGRRVLSVSATTKGFWPWQTMPNAPQSTSTTVNVRRGRTYVFTATWGNRNRIVLIRGGRS